MKILSLKNNFRLLLTFTFTLVIALFLQCSARAQSDVNFEISCPSRTVRSKDKISVYILALAQENSNLPRCKIHLEFDSDKLNFKQVNRKNGVKPSNIKTDISDNALDITYAQNRYGSVWLTELPTQIFEI